MDKIEGIKQAKENEKQRSEEINTLCSSIYIVDPINVYLVREKYIYIKAS